MDTYICENSSEFTTLCTRLSDADHIALKTEGAMVTPVASQKSTFWQRLRSFFYKPPSERLWNVLAKLMEDGAGKDLTILCSDGQIAIHASIARQIPWFCTRLESSMLHQEALGGLDEPEVVRKEIDLSYFPASTVKLMSQVLYEATSGICITMRWARIAQLIKP